jgi:regulatory protein
MQDEAFAPLPASAKQAKGQRSGPSLKARAVAFLARREYTRVELIKKLAPHCDDQNELERILDDLQASGWQSDKRYVQGLVNRKSQIHGGMRIVQTLKAQGISEEQIAEVKNELKNTELSRALNVWRKRFGSTGMPSEPKDYAKQSRFLAARGFSADIIRQVLKCGGDVSDLE